MSSKPAKYEVLIKKCLRSILDINALAGDIVSCSWTRHRSHSASLHPDV